MAYNDRHRLESIQYEATELLDFATRGGRQQYAFELTVDSQELDKALEILTNLGTRIRAELKGED